MSEGDKIVLTLQNFHSRSEKSQKMPKSRSRERRRSRSPDNKNLSRDHKRRDRSSSRDRHRRKDRNEPSRHEKRERSTDRRDRRDRSRERHQSSKHRDKSGERSRKRDSSRDRRRDRASSRSRKNRRSSSSDRNKPKPTASHSGSHPSNIKLDTIQMPNDESTSSTEQSHEKKFDARKTFEISNEFSREGFEQFTRDHGIDFTNIETEEDRVVVHEKMEEVLKAHFAAQGKIYPPPKVEKPIINAATGFANDGSFMEQFKKMQEDYKLQLEAEKKRKAAEERLKSLPIRRRAGGKILKTGVVAKTKLNEDGTEVPADPWSQYLKEVQKYKNSSCDSDSKTRPLVK